MSFAELLAWLFILLAVLQFVLWIIVVLAFAIAVLIDTDECRKESGLVLVGPWIWFLVALLLGPIGAAIYWFVNRSTLNPSVNRRQRHIESKRESAPPKDIVRELHHEGLLGSGEKIDETEVEQFLES